MNPAPPVLPVINLQEAKGATRPALASKLYKALTTTGFFYLEGIQEYPQDVLLKHTKWFFNLPLEQRMAITKKNFDPSKQHLYRGYFPVQPGEPSHKEGLEIGPPTPESRGVPNHEGRMFFEDNQWPHDSMDPHTSYTFQKDMEKYFEILTEAGLEIVKLMAEGCGISSDFLVPLFYPHHLSTFRLLHYPVRDDKIPSQARDGDTILLCEEHKDSTFLTLLTTFDYAGLQVRDEHGKWLDVPPRPNAMVVNIGVALSKVSGGLFKATNHRVVDTGDDRYSVPFFLEPKYDGDLNTRLPIPEALKDKPEGKHPYGPFLINRMTSLYSEFRELLKSV